MTAGKVCNREVFFTQPGKTVEEAGRLMREIHVGDLIVVDNEGASRRPVGILTDRDIVLDVVALGKNPRKVLVEEVMTADPVTVTEDAGITESIRTMRNRGVRRLPVVDRTGTLVGILTMDDFVDLLAEELNDLAILIRSEQCKEHNNKGTSKNAKISSIAD